MGLANCYLQAHPLLQPPPLHWMLLEAVEAVAVVVAAALGLLAALADWPHLGLQLPVAGCGLVWAMYIYLFIWNQLLCASGNRTPCSTSGIGNMQSGI